MNEWGVLLTASAVIISYGVLSRQLTRFVQPLRIEIADEGESLLQEDAVPASTKRDISLMLDMAYSATAAWVIAVMLSPAAFTVVFEMLGVLRPGGDPAGNLPNHLRVRVYVMMRKGFLCVLANSPLASALVLLQTVFWMVLTVPLGRALRLTLRTSSRALEAAPLKVT